MVSIEIISCTSGNCSANPNYGLVKQIDKKLHKLSKIELNNIRFHLDKHLDNFNEDDFNDLQYYKYVLLRKMNNDDCLCDFSMDLIISRIKGLINK